MLKTIALCAALSAAPTPSINYYAEISPDISALIMSEVADGKYYTHLDFNGDGELTVSDAVSVALRYEYNVTYGNKYVVNDDTIREIISENYADMPIYWEIDRIDNMPCRCYDIVTENVTIAEVYVEYEEYSETFCIEIDPYREIISYIN